MSLQFNVSSLLKEPVGSTREYLIEVRALVDESRIEARDIRGKANFLRTNDGILVSTDIRGIQPEVCSRCLKNIEVPVEMGFQEVFYPTSDIQTGIRVGKPEDPDAFRISERWILDLEEPIRQFWTAALPMQALCRPDCRGLCPQCGKDWNEGSCDCTPPADERWSALKTLLRK